MKNKYFMLIILCLCLFTIYASQFKIPPMVDMVREYFNISTSQVSWLISICTFAGILLAVPGTTIMNKIGPKNLLLILMAALGASNLIGFFTDNYSLLLFSRALEGIAIAMIVVVGLVMINTWFKDYGKGLAIGIFNSSGAVSVFVAMNIAIPIAKNFGLKSIWLIFTILSIALFALVLIYIKIPNSQKDGANVESVSLVKSVKNNKVWVLGLMMACNVFSLRTYITTYPQLFGSYYNIDPVKANFYASINGFLGIIACITCGIVVDKLRKPILICLISFVGLVFTGYFIDLLGPSTYILHSVCSAILCGYILTSVDIIAPTIAQKPIFVGYTISLVRLSYFLGAFASTPVILGTVAIYGWSTAKYIMIAVGLAGVVLTVLLMTQTKNEHHSFIN